MKTACCLLFQQAAGLFGFVCRFIGLALMKKSHAQRVAKIPFVCRRKVGVLFQKIAQRLFGLRVRECSGRIECGAKVFHQSSMTLRARSSGSLTPRCTRGPACHSQSP